MRFRKGMMYKLQEIDGALVISHQHQLVKDPSMQPLIAADAGALLTYLDRYVFEREAGKNLKDAHALAMGSAGVVPLILPK